MDFYKKITKIETLAKDIYLVRMQSQKIACDSMPGQFVNIRCSSGLDAFLRRPISICGSNKKDKTFDIVYMNRGKGTNLLCGFDEGDCLDVMGPLGKGFTLPEPGERIAVLGGGIGIFPLLYLLEKSAGVEKTAFLGFRTMASMVLQNKFLNASKELMISTDDGSFGIEGPITLPFFRWMENKRPDRVYTCGPLPMMKCVAEYCISRNIFCEVSMEQRMGCGIGACLVCACKVKEGDDSNYAHVCKDGPVFPAERLVL